LICSDGAWRIASSNGWFSAFGKPKRGRARRPGPPVHDDLCAVVDERGRTRHAFAADAPNQLWLTDITEHKTAEGKLYLCAIKDVFSGRIVEYSIDSRMKSRLATQALDNAVAMRGDVAGCVVHSDRGSQFRSRKMIRALARHRRSEAWAESGPAGTTLRWNRSSRCCRRTSSTAGPGPPVISCASRWSPGSNTYHRRRRQVRLGHLTPIELETIMNTTVALAA